VQRDVPAGTFWTVPAGAGMPQQFRRVYLLASVLRYLWAHTYVGSRPTRVRG
jgi:hypothetical protein